MKSIRIGDRMIGPNSPPYFIAEIGSNHNGDMDLCRRLVDEAKKAGADAVKFQSWDTKSLISKELYDKHQEYPGDKKRHFGSLYQMVEKYQLTPRQHTEMQEYCEKKGITFSSTPFSPAEADMLEKMDVPFFKVASMDVTNHPLLEHIAMKKKPVIMAVGMASLEEIAAAMKILQPAVDVILLHCVAVYPPKYEDIRLKNIHSLSEKFDVPVGFSDHTVGTAVPIAAIALGACVIEKHFTLDIDMEGWDHAVSADPVMMKYIVEEGKRTYSSLGGSERIVAADEMEKRKEFRRSIIAAKDLKKGQIISAGDITCKRPEEGGISPARYREVIGKTLAHDVGYDEKLKWDDLL